MGHLLKIAVCGSLALAVSSLAAAKPDQVPVTQSDSKAEGASDGLPALPSSPQGRTTVIGGRIHNLDPVRDQFTLEVFGGRAMKILFDARTQIYRDGKKISPSDLHSDEHASVETVLDGTSVFALSIHTLSKSPEGEYQGQLLHYNPDNRELTIAGGLSRQPIVLLVPAGTPVVREGQAASSPSQAVASDLVTGALISVNFEPDDHGKGVANHISILATPGSAFVFSGNLSFLDLDSGLLVLVDPQDGKSYQVSFDPAHFPLSRSLHQGEHVKVTARFNGAGYVATAIALS